MAGDPCARCGYDLRGVPGRDGLVTCPECGSPALRAPRLGSFWFFALGASAANYVMLLLALAGRAMGDPGLGPCLSMPIAVGTLLTTPLVAQELARPGEAWWKWQARGLGWWVVLNAPAAMLLVWLAR